MSLPFPDAPVIARQPMPRPAVPRARPKPARRSLLALEGGLSFAIVVVAPLLLSAAGLASILKLSYPAITCATAGLLYARRSPWYVGHCVWLFCATPLVRRLIDAQTGWDPSNPALLSPYLACVFTGVGAVHLLSTAPRLPRSALPFLVILGCIFYGLILATLDERVLSSLIEAMKWSAGPLMALHVMQSGDGRAEVRGVLICSLLIAVPLMAAYGIAQYIDPMQWDSEWVENVKSLGLDSIGVAKPFGLRVFGTMNSPGSLGAMLSFGILAAFQRRIAVMLPVTLLAVLALLLTEYRAVWAGCLLGTLYLGTAGSARSYGRVIGIVLTVAGATSAIALVPQMQEAVVARVQSLDNLGADASGEDRLHQYEAFISNGDDSAVIGQGLAIDGASRRLDNKSINVIDSGIIEIFSVYGIVVGTIFAVGMADAIARTFSLGPSAEMCFYRAGTITLFCQVPFGSVFVGESGFCAWLFLGLAAAASDQLAAQVTARRCRHADRESEPKPAT